MYINFHHNRLIVKIVQEDAFYYFHDKIYLFTKVSPKGYNFVDIVTGKKLIKKTIFEWYNKCKKKKKGIRIIMHEYYNTLQRLTYIKENSNEAVSSRER